MRVEIPHELDLLIIWLSQYWSVELNPSGPKDWKSKIEHWNPRIAIRAYRAALSKRCFVRNESRITKLWNTTVHVEIQFTDIWSWLLHPGEDNTWTDPFLVATMQNVHQDSAALIRIWRACWFFGSTFRFCDAREICVSSPPHVNFLDQMILPLHRTLTHSQPAWGNAQQPEGQTQMYCFLLIDCQPLAINSQASILKIEALIKETFQIHKLLGVGITLY